MFKPNGCCYNLAISLGDSVVCGIYKVALHRAWLVLGWVTVSEFNSGCGRIYLSI